MLTEIAMLAGTPDAVERLDRAMKDGLGAERATYSPYTPRAMRAFLDMRAGDAARARPLAEAALAANREAMAAGDKSFTPLMENAALYLMLGDRAAALDALDAGARAGWADAMFLARDPLLAELRGEPRFSAIVQRIERDIADMRARADFRQLDELAGAPVSSR